MPIDKSFRINGELLNSYSMYPTWEYSVDSRIYNPKDIIIMNMAEYISKLDIEEDICAHVKIGICEQYNKGNCKECIRKYFSQL